MVVGIVLMQRGEAMDDAISRAASIDAINKLHDKPNAWLDLAVDALENLPSAHPYTDEEIQAMQDLEQAQLDKAYELGWKDGREALRQASIDALDKEYRCTDKSDDWDGLKTAMLIIENLPSAQSQRTGRWIDGKCNKCGTHAPYWAMASTYYCSEYCPHCGAYMVTEEEM